MNSVLAKVIPPPADRDTFQGWLYARIDSILGPLSILLTGLVTAGFGAALVKWAKFGEAAAWQPLGLRMAIYHSLPLWTNLGLLFFVAMILNRREPPPFPPDFAKGQLGVSSRESQMREDALGNALDGVHRFRHYWRILCMLWFVMYFIKTAANFPVPIGGGRGYHALMKLSVFGPSISQVFFNEFNNVVNVFFAVCYLCLTEANSKKTLHWEPFAFAAFLLAVFDITLRFVYWETTSTSDIRIVLEIMLDLMFGLYGAITLTLIVGRLESRYVAPPQSVLLSLYLYASFQIIVLVVDELKQYYDGLAITDGTKGVREILDHGTTMLYFSVSALKAILLLFVYWVMTRGSLSYYFYQKGRLDASWSPERQTLLKDIREKTDL